MGLASVILSALAIILALAAIALSMWNTIHLQAQRLSTHTVIPVSPETTMSKIEEQLSGIIKDAGGNQNDLNRNLYSTGLDADELC